MNFVFQNCMQNVQNECENFAFENGGKKLNCSQEPVGDIPKMHLTMLLLQMCPSYLISSISSSPPAIAAATPPPPPPPQQTSPILTLATQTRVTRKRGWKIVEEHSDTFPDLPPAKRISKLRLTFCDEPENILNIERRPTRSSKRNKK